MLAPFLEVNAKGTLLALVDARDLSRMCCWWTRPPATRSHTLRGHRDLVRDIRFSPDGSLVGSAPADDELIVWDTATGRPLERWDIFDEWGVGFSPDNDLVYGGGGGDSMLRTWDLSMEDTYLQQTTQVGDAEVFTHADISPDGQQVAYSWLDDQDRGWVRFVDTVTGDATSPIRFPVWDELLLVERRRRLASRRRPVRRVLVRRHEPCASARHRDRPRLRHGPTPPETPRHCRWRRRHRFAGVRR